MNAHSPSKVAKRSKEWDSSLPRKLNAAIHDFAFEDSSAKAAIVKLAPDFEVDGIRLDADSTIIENDEWIAPGTVFLKIRYQADDGSDDTFDESLPILVKFVLEGGSIKIRDIEADVSSFEA